MLKSVISTFNQNMFKERCHRLLMVRYWCSNIEPKSNKNSVGETYSKDKSSWKFYPSDLVIKNLKPDSVPRHYKMVYRSSVETITNFCILVNTSTMLGFSAFIISTKSSELVEMASVESMCLVQFIYTCMATYFSVFISGVLGAFALFSYVALLYTSALQVPLRMYYSAEVKLSAFILIKLNIIYQIYQHVKLKMLFLSHLLSTEEREFFS